MAKNQICGLFSEVDLIQMLVRLPVKSLFRFKLVCKSWCKLIKSPSFIDLHITTTTTPNSSSSSSSSSNKFGSFIFLASVHKTSRENSLIMLLPESESGSEYSSISRSGGGWRWWSTTGDDDDDEDRVFTVDNSGGSQLVLQLDSLGVPPCYKDSYFFKKILGSCNGLISLYDRDMNRFSLWNPTTKQYRVLPKPIDVDWPHKLMSFGFDVKTKDYKVMLLTGFIQEFCGQPIECVCRIQVYSLSTDSWRVVERITCLPGDPFRGPMEVQYVNGRCFFMASFFRTKRYLPRSPENDRFILSFDLTKEIITPIQLPDHHQDQTLYLSCLADKMAIFTVKYQPRLRPYPPTGFCDDYSMWALLNEYGSSSSNNVNKDSWTKLHSFQIAVQRPDERNIPRGISNDGKFALLEIKDLTGMGKRLKLYDSVSKQVKRNFLSCGSVGSKANAFKRTLVSIRGANDAGVSMDHVQV